MRSIEAVVIRMSVGMSLLLAFALPALAADKTAEVRAVVSIVPPAVMEERGRLTGFSIDLWNEVAAKLNRRRATRSLQT